MKKILISTYHFYPEVNPRAFRAFELAKSFSQMGHNVDVVIPSNDCDYSDIEKKFNIKVHSVKAGFFLHPYKRYIKQVSSDKKNNSNFVFKKILRLVLNCFYPGGKNFEYAFTLYSFLKKLPNTYDTVISISFPISVHLGTRWYISRLPKKPLSIADSGDPFSFNPEISSKCFYYQTFEKYVLKPFDYMTIPIPEAKKLYENLTTKNKIRIIPQSVDYKNIQIKAYKTNKIITFGYAGVFYKNIRNPKILFEFLTTLKNVEFKFIIFTNTESSENMELIIKYKDILGDKLEIRSLLPREKCIYELSGMDFVINQNNINSEQKPSKIIDYMVTMRPTYNYDQNNFDQYKFLQMFHLEKLDILKLQNEYKIKLKKFDSEYISSLFLNIEEMDNMI